MSLYKQFRTDSDLEVSGIFLEYGENSKKQPIRFKVARAGGSNSKFDKVLAEKTKPYRGLLKNDSMDPKLAEKLVMHAYCESVLLGWEGVEDENGNELPFSADNAKKLFTDLPDLFADIREQAGRAALFRQHILEQEAGN